MWRSTTSIPEPHSFDVELSVSDGKGLPEVFPLQFREEGEEGADLRSEISDEDHKQPKKYQQDNNYRGALLHVVADAFVSVLAIAAIAIAGNVPRARFLDPVAGIIGALVIISWGYQLSVDSMTSLLDLCPDPQLTCKLRRLVEADRRSLVTDLHVWKVGPGYLGVVMSVVTTERSRTSVHYKQLMKRISALAHVTVEVNYAAAAEEVQG